MLSLIISSVANAKLIKPIAAGAGVLGLVLAAVWFRGVLADRAEYLARAEAAEAQVVSLTEANTRLQAAGQACAAAAAAQSQAAVAAMTRREELEKIMESEPAPEQPGSKSAPQPAKPVSGGRLSDAQDRQMVVFWNDLFVGLGVR